MIAAAGNIKGAVGENLRRALDWLPTGRQLLTIKTDCDLNGHVEGLPAMNSIAINDPQTGALKDFYEKFGFKGLARALEGRAAGASATPTATRMLSTYSRTSPFFRCTRMPQRQAHM